MSIQIIIMAAVLHVSMAWNSTGHYIVARIAEKELLEDHEEIHQKLLDILALNAEYAKERDHPFVEASTYASDVRYHNWTIFNSWHYALNYIKRKGAKVATKDLASSPQDIVFAINEAKNTLRNTKYSRIEDRFGKSFMLRYLIHLIGDIHQPLHNVSFISENFKYGDMGGNLFHVDAKGEETLHDLWDNCLGVYDSIDGPISKDDWTKLDRIVAELMRSHTRGALKGRMDSTGTSVKKWSDESRKIAAKDIYSDMKAGQKFDSTYREAKKDIVRTQLALAGYRLADVLIELFNGDKKDRLESHRKKDAGEDSDVDNDSTASPKSKAKRSASSTPKRSKSKDSSKETQRLKSEPKHKAKAEAKAQKLKKRIVIDSPSKSDDSFIDSESEEEIAKVKKQTPRSKKPSKKAKSAPKKYNDDSDEEYEIDPEEEFDYFQLPPRRSPRTRSNSAKKNKAYYQRVDIAPEVELIEEQYEEDAEEDFLPKAAQGWWSSFTSKISSWITI